MKLHLRPRLQAPAPSPRIAKIFTLLTSVTNPTTTPTLTLPPTPTPSPSPVPLGLDQDELMAGMRDMGLMLSNDEFLAFFHELDKDDDGTISCDEFTTAITGEWLVVSG